MKKTSMLLSGLLCLCIMTYGQVTSGVFSKNYTPSPEAYSLMQYEEIPVSLYAGVTSVSVPIYTIQVGDNSIPVSLSYHTSGIKIAQEASWVGLGWSLQAGGCISRSICGFNDFASGFLDDTEPMPIDDVEAPYLYYDSSGKLSRDPQPDVFVYNFGGYSGKFYSIRGARAQNKDRWFTTSNPESNLQIRAYGSQYDVGFIVTTPDNVKYHFQSKEIQQRYGKSYSGAMGMMECPDIDNDYNPREFDSSNTVTSWYLTRIDYPTGDHVYFDYSIKTNAYLSPLFKTSYGLEVIEKKIYEPEYRNDVDNAAPRSVTYTNIENVLKQPLLKKIRWKDGSLEFIPSTDTRLDIRTLNNSYAPKRLGMVKLYGVNESYPLKTFILHHSYFWGKDRYGQTESVPANLRFLTARLKLDSISIKGTGSSSLKYRMEYDLSESLPQKNGFSCDKWGYYNGTKSGDLYMSFTADKNYYSFIGFNGYTPIQSPNETLIKKGELRNYFNSSDKTSSSKACLWMLTAFTTPTDGRTEFKYECNTALDFKEKIWVLKDSVQAVVCVRKEFGNQTQIAVGEFDMPFDGCIDVSCMYDGGMDCYKEEAKTVIVEISPNIYKQVGIPSGLRNTGSDIHGQYSFSQKVSCKKGHYTVTLRTTDVAITQLVVNIKRYKAIFQNREIPVGGVRISEIKSPISFRKLYYKDDQGVCSGRLVRDSYFNSVALRPVIVSVVGISAVVGCYQVIKYNSVAQRSLENPYNNYFMGYNQVNVVRMSTTGDQLLEKSYFHNEFEYTMNIQGYPGEMLPQNGLLEKHEIYLGDKLQSIKTMRYDTNLLNSTRAIKVNNFDMSKTYYVDEYHIGLSSETESVYAWPDNAAALIGHIETDYEYSSANHLLSRKVVTNKDGSTIEQRIRYSADFPNYHNGYFQKNNLVTTPIEESFYADDVLRKRLWHIHYKDSLVKPWKEYVFNNKAGYDAPPTFDGNIAAYNGIPEAVYTAYDSKARNIAAQTRMGQSVVLIWGYQHQHVIAQISNATLDELTHLGIDSEAIASKIRPAEIDWARLHALRMSLPQARVIITEYEPLVGVISQTDPRGVKTRYTYDEFGRLNETIETGTNEILLKKNQYKYATED